MFFTITALSGSIHFYKKNETLERGFRLFGGDEGDRTPYLLNAIQALSQMSYTPETDILLTHYSLWYTGCQLIKKTQNYSLFQR